MAKEKLCPAVKSAKGVKGTPGGHSTLTTPQQPTGKAFSEYGPGKGEGNSIMKK